MHMPMPRDGEMKLFRSEPMKGGAVSYNTETGETSYILPINDYMEGMRALYDVARVLFS